MRLSFLRIYKSITSFPETELPNFVVLTGVNGAGKSHLLEAIENGSMRIDDIVVNDQTRSIRRFDWKNLIPHDVGAFAPFQITQEKSVLWNEFYQYVKEYRPQISRTLQQLNRFDLDKLEISEIMSLTSERLISTGSTPEQANQIVQAIRNITSRATQDIATRFTQKDRNRSRLVDLFQKNTNKPFIAFEEDDFYDYFPSSWQPIDMFQQSFGRLFADYQSNWLKNRMKYMASRDGEDVTFLTDKEFIDKYGEPPWDVVNSVLEAANLDLVVLRM